MSNSDIYIKLDSGTLIWMHSPFRSARITAARRARTEEFRGLLRLGVVVGLAHDLLLLVQRRGPEHDLLPRLLVHRRLGPHQRCAQPRDATVPILQEGEGGKRPEIL